MSERIRSDSARYQQGYQTNPTKMPDSDLGTRKTLFVLVIVVGCFAVLWPKVFYPMLVGPTNQRMKPSKLDKGCCDVISDIDVNTIKILSELCNNIVQSTDDKPLKSNEIIIQCRTMILNECGIDISAILEEQVRLGRTFKQIVEEVRSLNGSLCLKYKFGISPSKLGASHRIRVNLSPVYIRQERPTHLRPEMLHPALREKGRAIAEPYTKSTQPRVLEGRPGPVPGVRPPMGGAGHVVHSQKGTGSMGVIMPIYTIGIVIFFSYTLMKLLFKKKTEGAGAPLYPPVEPSMTFKRDVFETQKVHTTQRPGSSKLVVNAMTALLDEVDQELEARRRASEVASQKDSLSNGTTLANGSAKKAHEPEQPSVKVLGMEMTASCEGGQKWSRPESPIIPQPPPPVELDPPKGTLPAQSQLLVAESTIEEEPNSSSDPPVVLASKMTLSVISLDSLEGGIGTEADEAQKLRNGDVTTQDDLLDESKYTTASAATTAEHDLLDEECTESEEEIDIELDKVPEYVVDNGVQEKEDTQNDIDDELESEEEIEEVEVSEEEVSEEDEIPQPKLETKIDTKPEPTITKSGVKFIEVEDDEEEVEEEEEEEEIEEEEEVEEEDDEDNEEIVVTKKTETNKFMTPEVIESIGDVIDDVIDMGTRLSERIVAEKNANEDVEIEDILNENEVTESITNKDLNKNDTQEAQIETEENANEF